MPEVSTFFRYYYIGWLHVQLPPEIVAMLKKADLYVAEGNRHRSVQYNLVMALEHVLLLTSSELVMILRRTFQLVADRAEQVGVYVFAQGFDKEVCGSLVGLNGKVTWTAEGLLTDAQAVIGRSR